MKNSLKFAVAAALAFSTFSLSAADGKDVKLSGEGKCAKCALKEAKECQNVVQVKNGDKTTTYYLKGDVSQKFHKNLCGDTAKINVEGNCVKDGEKLVVTVAKIELAK
jgi:hypothetical protein